MNKKKNSKKNQKDVKKDVQHATNTVNKNLTTGLEVEFIRHIHAVFMDINSFQWVVKFGLLIQKNAFLFNVMIKD
jgi:hypothetical protein